MTVNSTVFLLNDQQNIRQNGAILGVKVGFKWLQILEPILHIWKTKTMERYNIIS
jgi:hypothetical protein